jgi:Rieske 2Fe-2S family protein
MHDFAPIAELLNQDRPGYTLPQRLYTSEEAFAFDTQVMLKSVWLYACTVAHVKNPGDFYVFEMANNSVVILRGKDGVVRAFYNTCTHRGSRLCEAQSGSMPRVMCPYHFWTFGLDGKLIAARGMPGRSTRARTTCARWHWKTAAGCCSCALRKTRRRSTAPRPTLPPALRSTTSTS